MFICINNNKLKLPNIYGDKTNSTITSFSQIMKITSSEQRTNLKLFNKEHVSNPTFWITKLLEFVKR